MKLSNLIYKVTRKYNIPSNIYTAILMQESGYRLKAKRCHVGLIARDKSICESSKYVADPLLCTEPVTEIKVCTDFGMSQIYYKTANAFGFDINKLTADLEYSVNAGAKVLDWFHKTYGHKEIDWWVRYNCGTSKSINRSTCNIYKRLVSRYL